MPPPEVWLRGPVSGVPALLQPVAHGLLQCQEEVRATLPLLTREQIWTSPGGAASIGFHVRHAIGSLDRLFTYARGERLTSEQLGELKLEKQPDALDASGLVSAFDTAVERAVAQLRSTPASTLTDGRGVGRAQLASTVLGLLFHAAEHTQRHMGQMTTSSIIIRASARS